MASGYLKIIYRAILKPVLQFFSLFISLIWTVGSGYYLVNEIGTYLTEGRIVLISQLDSTSPSAITTEWWLLVSSAIYWTGILIYVIYSSLKKECQLEKCEANVIK
jgi:hypothetical protein